MTGRDIADRFCVIEDAMKLIAAVGSERWGVVRNRHPGVSTSTFWRAVWSAKADLAAEGMRIVSEQGSRNARAHPVRGDASGYAAAADTPAFPLRVDYLHSYQILLAVVTALRQCAMNADGSVRAPAIVLLTRGRRLSGDCREMPRSV